MISIFRKPKLYQVHLCFGIFPGYPAQMCDPDFFDPNRQDPDIRAADPHGYYWLNGPTLADSVGKIYTDSTGAYEVSFNNIFTACYISDMFGNVAYLNIVSNTTEIYPGTHTTWSAIKLPYRRQTMTASLLFGAEIKTYGVIWTEKANLTDTDQDISSTPYLCGITMDDGEGTGAHMNIDMSVPGRTKPTIEANTDVPYMWGAEIKSRVNSSNTTASTITFTPSTSSTYPSHCTATLPNGVDMPFWNNDRNRHNVQIDYVNQPRNNQNFSTITSSDWYITYDVGGDDWTHWRVGYWNGTAYPLYDASVADDGRCDISCIKQPNDPNTNQGHYFHASSQYDDNGNGIPSNLVARIFLKSDTPSATGGEDDGDPPAGWYRDTASYSNSTYTGWGDTNQWYYWDGIRFLEAWA